jgi:hypothetical protein
MSSTTEGRKSSKWYAVERALAPHVDEKWAGRLLLELRMLGVKGDRIGAALSEVESHCSESGDSAQQAFGDPVEYARSLQLPVADDTSARAMLRSVAPIMVQMLGMTALDWGFRDWLRGQQLEITTGQLANASLSFLVIVAVIWFFDPVIRLVLRRPVLGSILVALPLTAATATGLVVLKPMDTVIWRMSAGWGLAVGAAVLAGGVVWAVARIRAGGSQEDPVTSPFPHADTSLNDEATRSRRRWSTTFPSVALIPLGTLFLFALSVVLHQLGAK